VGGGWELRWNQVAKEVNHGAIRNVLVELAQASQRTGEHVEINVVGHSLGGVVAELAGLDVEDVMNRLGANYEVNVVAFNPPKIGSQDFVNEYRRRLKERPRRFRISVFTREGDLVDDVPTDYFGIVAGYFHQVIDNVRYDNLTPLCSPFMFGETDNPLAVDPEDQAKKLPYAPRLHVTRPFPYGAHSIDSWVGNHDESIKYRQVLTSINPHGFRCMFAPDSLGTIGRDTVARPPVPKLNCTAYATLKFSGDEGDCNPSPPPPGNPRDDL